MPQQKRKRSRRKKEEEIPETIPDVASDELLKVRIFYHLEPAIQSYFKNVEVSLHEDSLFLDNVYAEVRGQEVELATDHDCSRILEKLINMSTLFQQRVFVDALSGRWVELMTQRFASHVCELLIGKMCMAADTFVGDNDPINKDAGVLRSPKELVLGICEEIRGELCFLMADIFGSHCLRDLLSGLSGKVMKSASARSMDYRKQSGLEEGKQEAVDVPKEFGKEKKRMHEELGKLSPSELRTLATHAVASPVIQHTIEMMGHSKSDDLVKRILGISDESDDWVEHANHLLIDRVGSHVMQRCLSFASDGLLQIILQKTIKGRVVDFATHDVANFCIRAVLEKIENEEVVHWMYDEVKNGVKQIFRSKKIVVLSEIARLCRLHKHHQKEYFDILISALSPYDNAFIALLYLQGQPIETDEPSPFAPTLLAQLLSFPHTVTQTIVDSLLKLSPERIIEFCVHPIASRCVEHAIMSPTLPPKHLRRLVRAMIGSMVTFATDKYASHLIDKAWTRIDVSLKEEIARELAEKESMLKGHFYGKFIASHLHLNEFRKNKSEWLEKERKVRIKA